MQKNPIAGDSMQSADTSTAARKRALGCVTGLLIFVLFAVAAGAGWFAVRGELQRRDEKRALESTKLALDAAEKQLRIAESETADAETEADEWRQVVAFLQETLRRPPDAAQKESSLEDLLRNADRRLSEMTSADHPKIEAAIRQTLGDAYGSIGRFADAERHLRAEVELRRKISGPKSPQTLHVLNRLAMMLRDANQGAAADAEAEVYSLFQTLISEDPPGRIPRLFAAAAAAEEAGDLDTALSRLRWAMRVFRGVFGPRHPHTATGHLQLAQLYIKRGECEQAIQSARAALTIVTDLVPPEHLHVTIAQAVLGMSLICADNYSEAERVLTRCLESRRRTLPPGHWLIGSATSLLGAAVAGQQRWEEAERLLKEGLATMQASEQTPGGRVAEARARLVELYDAWGRPDQAAQFKSKTAAPASAPAPQGMNPFNRF